MDAHQDKQMGCPKTVGQLYVSQVGNTFKNIQNKSIRAETRPLWTSDFSELVNPKASIIC